MHGALEAVRADRAALGEICGGLTAAQWQAASGCPGWSVQDLVTHLANTFWAVVDQSQLAEVAGQPFELGTDIQVQARRGRQPEAVLADYEEVSKVALDRLAELAALDMELPLGEIGTYPAALLPCAYAFDHYVHIREDLFGPRGPLEGAPPSTDELRLAPTLDWIEAALPQQNPAAAAENSFEFQVTGPCARVIGFGSGPMMARLSCDAPGFVRFITQRGGQPRITGDDEAVAAARNLKVF
jgi:uncharacterized protein (TIGR03083 family)